jgi:hypothetical protein
MSIQASAFTAAWITLLHSLYVAGRRVRKAMFFSRAFSRFAGVTKAESATYTKAPGSRPCVAMWVLMFERSSLLIALSEALPSLVASEDRYVVIDAEHCHEELL